MSKICAVTPRVKSISGKIVDSKLFKDLKNLTHERKQTVDVYLRTKNPTFIKGWDSVLDKDSNKEYTLKSVLNKTDINQLVPEENILKYLNSDTNVDTKPMEDSMLNRHTIEGKIKDFNNKNYKDSYIATIKKDNVELLGKSISMEISRNNPKLSQEAEKSDSNYTLNEALYKILARHNVPVTALNAFEQRRNITGVTDFQVAEDAAHTVSVAIRLAEGKQGQDALPEEFSHFALEALGNHPLVTRLLNSIDSEEILKDILGKEYELYSKLYSSNHEKLLKEAAGKLIAEQLVVEQSGKGAVTVIKTPGLLERIMNLIKKIFSGMQESEVEDALKKAEIKSNVIAKKLLNGQLESALKMPKVSKSSKFYQTSVAVNTKKAIYTKIIDTAVKKLKIYKTTNVNASPEYIQKNSDKIKALEASLANNTVRDGMYTYMKDTLAELQEQEEFLDTIEDPDLSKKDQAGILREVRNFIFAYSPIVESFQEDILGDNSDSPFYDDDIRIQVNNVALLIDKLFIKYNKIAEPLFVEFMEPYLGDEEARIVPFGKDKGQKITAIDLIRAGKKDITTWDAFIDSMANSNDPLLAIVDQVFKKRKSAARFKTLEDIKKIQLLGYKAEKAGIKNFDWMYALNSKGEKTNQYIGIVDKIKFFEDKKAFRDSLDLKYGKNAKAENVKNKGREWFNWINENADPVDENFPLSEKYISKQYVKETTAEGNNGNQALADAKKQFLKDYLEIKESLEADMPENLRDTQRAVLIRKDTIERVKNSESFKTGATELWEGIKDAFVRRSDDTDLGNISTIIDFEGREVESIPVLYNSIKEGESYNDISTDAISTLAAYADMANNYTSMGEVVDIMEVGRHLMRKRKLNKRSGLKKMVSHIKEAGYTYDEEVTVSGDSTKFMSKLNNFYARGLYGHYAKDQGTIKGTNIDIAKGANNANKFTALNSLSLNILAGVNNVAVGTTLMRVEAISGEFFKHKDLVRADATYVKELPKYLAQVGDRIKDNKMYLWIEHFNILQDQDRAAKEINFDRKTWMSRLFSSSLLFIMSECGEHWMQTRTSLSLSNAYKMRSPTGEIVSLYEAMEAKALDPKNPKGGSHLVVKKGYTTNILKQGSSTEYKEFNQEDADGFARKSAEINHTLHGIYNTEDSNAIQQYALGRMAYMFRKWIPAAINKRYGNTKYNYDTKTWTEGYYTTAWRVSLQLMKEMKDLRFAFGTTYKNLHPTEKANIKRALGELGSFLVVAAAIALIPWDTDKDRPWGVKFFEYQLRRLYTELGTTTPTTAALSESFKILKTPAAAFTYFEKTMNLLSLFNPVNYTDTVQSGRYKGHSEAFKSWANSPLVPFYSTLYRGMHPETVLPFYKQ